MAIKPYNNITTHAVFFGTHSFASTILEALINNPQISLDLVVTQPDKPVGRSQKLQPPPVKIIAEQNKIKVEQPKSLKNYELGIMNYDLAIVAQYGELIPEEILKVPKYGALNVHPSLLPKYRGASPIQSALINGESETGVTIMKMDAGMDTGPIILQKTVKIALDDTYPVLEKKLARIGSQALLGAVPKYISGELKPIAQDGSKATSCKQLTRDDGKIVWTKSASEIYNQYRGLTPWPGVWTMWNGKRLKLLKIQPANVKAQNFAPPHTPGKVKVEGDKMYIGCGEGAIEVLEIQTEGKKPIDSKNFLNGNNEIKNSFLK